MKRTLALILALVMIVGMIPMSVFADETTPTLTFTHDVTDVSALKAGDTFTVTATLTNNPGFAAFQFDLDWDNTVVQFDGFGMYEGRYGLEFDSEVTLPNEYDNQSGTIVIGVSDNITRNGYLFKANFTVLKEGDADITFKKEWPFYELKQADESPVTVTFDESALAELTITHTHDYTHSVVVTDPTCTEQGYTTRTCACGESIKDTYVSATGHIPSTTEAGKCSVCGTAITVIPEGAPFLEIVTADGKNVTVTDMGMEPNYQMGTLYKVEVPLGTTQVNITYNQGDVLVDQFGYASVFVVNDPNVSQDGYGQTTKEGKTIVGLQMEKAAANGFGTIKLLNIPYPSDPYELRAVGLMKDYYGDMHFFAFTYALEEGQHFAVLPEGVGYTVSGNAIASNGYKFNVAIDEGFEDTEDFAVKVNGETIATQPGEVTVSSVTEDLYITVEGVAKIADPDNDIILTVDLTGYTGEIEGSIWYSDNEYNNVEIPLTAGKKNTLALTASKSQSFFASIYSISPLVVGYDVNGTVYAIPNSYTGHDLGNGYYVNLNNDGYMQLGINGTNPGTFVIKPVLGTSESVGAAPDFAEPGTIDVTDITVVGADVISSAWEGDTLNVILAEDTALNASLKTMWTIYANNTKEGASQPCFNINGRLQTPSGTEATFTWVESMTLEDGTATKTAAFAVADMPWNPESALEFTPKTFTVNFYVSGKEPAPEPEQPASNPITDIEISHPNIKTETNPETGATSMTMAMVTGASETIDLSFTVQNADQEATQEIAWSSSNPEVAAVENGKVTALKAGETTITAKAVDPSGVAAAAEGEEVLAQFTLTVSDPTAGYTVTMGEVKPVDAGETIQIPVTVGYSAAENETAPTTYKSYELTFQYDTDMLTLVTGSSDDEAQEFTVVDESGTVTLRRYGNEKHVGEAAVTLEFTAKKTGESDVKLTSAKVGTSADAQDQNIPDAAIIDNLTKITVTGYDVDLDDAFTGAGVADPEKDYTFEAKDKNYIYTVTVTVGDKTFDIRDEDKDGSLTIPKDKITGNMKIVVQSAVGKTFDVTIEDDAAVVTGNPKAQYMTDYVLTVAEGVDLTGYTIKYKIGDGEEKTMSNCTIPGGEITGNITITVTAPGTDPEDPDRPANSWKITFEGNGKDDVQANSNYVTKGQPYTFQINKTEGYTYIVTYMGENGVEELTAAKDGTYTITPTADMTIKVMKWNVEVNQYVALNGKTVFLVSVAGEADIGMQYDGKTMFVKSVNALGEGGKYTGEAADKYVYLVELAEGTLNVEDAARKLSIVENVTCENIEKTFNVNGSSNLDINDAQLVYDMYNNVYQSIATENIGMLKFLKADVNCDRTIGVQDAAAVVNEILK